MLERNVGVAATSSLESQPVPSADTQKSSLSILGSTGSVGQSTLDLVAHAPERFEIVALTAHANAEKLAQQALEYGARLAVIGDASRYEELRGYLAGSDIEVAAGEAGLVEAAARPVDCVVCAIVGAAGLRPSIAAARQGRRVALANKECLVSAGEIFMREIATAGTTLLPVDSEHSAVHQVIEGESAANLERLVITASGGPFRTWTSDEIAEALPEQALRHPNWSMGAKISIDSATMMNKGLELIEAYHLFEVAPDKLGVVVHPQSIVHCLVEFCDGSVIAQLANPDMRTPIARSLAWPDRMDAPTERLDLVKLGALTFEAPDLSRFPALRLAQETLAAGGSAPNILNAANECAVTAFLEKRVSFPRIAGVVSDTLERAEGKGLMRRAASIDDVFAIDFDARQLARELIGK